MHDDVTELLTRAEDSAQHITWAIVDCAEEDLRTPADEGEWSPMQIFGHVKACDDIMTSRIATLLTHPNPTLVNFDENAWQAIAGYDEAPLDQTLMAFQRHRSEMLFQLKRLPEDAWNRTAQHETRGTLTLFDLVRTFIEHEEAHVAQLEAAFADDDVVADAVTEDIVKE